MTKIKRIIIIGAPRTGTTVLKRFLGSNEGLEFLPYSNSIDGIELVEQEYSVNTIKVWKRTKWLQEEFLSKLVYRYGDTSLFIVTYRYPEDCFHSLFELNEIRGHKTHKWLDYDKKENFFKWMKTAYHKASKILENCNYLFICYEDFCTDPLNTKKTILNKVGIKSDGKNFYNNSGWYIEDEKCLNSNQVYQNSIRRFSTNSDADNLYNEIKEIANS